MASLTQELDPSTVPVVRRPSSRIAQLTVGLVPYGVSMACMIRARLGLDPWDVLHQRTGALARLELRARRRHRHRALRGGR